MKRLILGLIAMFSLQVMAEFVVPATPHPVNDYAGVLSEGAKNSIARQLIDLKKETGAQGGVLIVDSLNGSSIEEASMKVVEAWKLGSKSADSGVLLMIATKERKTRLEIGRGLEGLLTDADSKRILANMRGDLRSGNYAGAVAGAIDAVSGTIVAHKADIMTKSVGAETDSGFGAFLIIALLLAFGGMVAWWYYFTLREKKVAKTAEPKYTPYRSSGVTGTAPSYSSKKTSGDTYIAPIIVSNHSDYGGYSSSSSDSGSSSSSSSDNSSSWSGGGGDFSGGGSSDSY